MSSTHVDHHSSSHRWRRSAWSFFAERGPDRAKPNPLLAKAAALRHKVFVQQHGWDLPDAKPEVELDCFDNDQALHIYALEGDELFGYSRLLPTTGPNLLRDVYPHLATSEIPRGEHVMEWTRYAVDPRKRGETAISNAGSHLFIAVLALAVELELEYLSMQTHPMWITRFCDFGFDVTPLGIPQTVGNELVIAFTINVDETATRKTRRLLRVRDSVDVEFKLGENRMR